MKHYYTVEILIHVQCGKCKRDYSVSVMSPKDSVPCYCPRCGAVGSVSFGISGVEEAKSIRDTMADFVQAADSYIAKQAK